MAYIKPGGINRIFNSLARRTGAGHTSTLTVAGRQSSEPRKFAVIALDYEGARYLVSTRGESEWVRNVRAAGGSVELSRKGETQAFQAAEVPAGERSPIIAAYRKLAGREVDSYFKKLADPADHPVFRLSPASN